MAIAHDRARAAMLADSVDDIIHAVETLRLAWLPLWNTTNKPNGFEVLNVRLGGIEARMKTGQQRMRSFANGECDTIPELAEPALPYMKRSDGVVEGCYAYGGIASACKVNG